MIKNDGLEDVSRMDLKIEPTFLRKMAIPIKNKKIP